MKHKSFNRLAATLTVLAALSVAPAAQAQEPALSSPTRALAEILDCLAEALNGAAHDAATLVAAADRPDEVARPATGQQVAAAD